MALPPRLAAARLPRPSPSQLPWFKATLFTSKIIKDLVFSSQGCAFQTTLLLSSWKKTYSHNPEIWRDFQAFPIANQARPSKSKAWSVTREGHQIFLMSFSGGVRGDPATWHGEITGWPFLTEPCSPSFESMGISYTNRYPMHLHEWKCDQASL